MYEPMVANDHDKQKKRWFRTLQRVRIPLLQRSHGLAAGVHCSAFRGHGIEFSELREYVPGDDIRAIDWKVTARLDRPFTRIFSEERDVTVCFCVDVSGSTGFGSWRCKAETAKEITGSLVLSALVHHDAIGLLLFSDRVEKFIPPRKGLAHALDIINTLYDYRPASKGTDLMPMLRYLSGALKRQSSVVLVSDFIAPPFMRELVVLKRRHQVFAISIADPRERAFPDVGYITLEDEESGEQLIVDTSSEEFRSRFSKSAHENAMKVRRDLARHQVPLATVTTDSDWEPELRRFFRG
jgi:uncharacterized protein (DUF58 family)